MGPLRLASLAVMGANERAREVSEPPPLRRVRRLATVRISRGCAAGWEVLVLARLRVSMAATVVAVLLATLASSPVALASPGATTLGPGLNAPEDGEACQAGADGFTPGTDCLFFQTTGTAGVITQSPTDGTVTTWRVDAFRGSARLVVVHPNSAGSYSITARSAKETVPCQPEPPVFPTCGPINQPAQFMTSLPIRKGDYIGIEAFNPPSCQKVLSNDQACADVGIYVNGTGIENATLEAVDATPADNIPFTPSRSFTRFELDFNADVVPSGVDGAITDGVTGKGLAQATVHITGTEVGGTHVDDTVLTRGDGTYADPLGAGTYSVQPEGVPPGEPLGLGYSVGQCDGAAGSASCAVTLGSNETKTASFAYPDCTGLRLAVADPLADATFGARLGTDVKLKGDGFCPGMSVQFGNDQASAEVSGTDISAGGTIAKVTVPKYASTGDLKVHQLVDQPDGTTVLEDAKLAGRKFQIDSFRNTHGFRFNNFGRFSNLDEFNAAFGVDQTSIPETINTCPGTGNCPKTTYVLTDEAQNIFIDGVDQLHGECFGMVLASQRLWTHDPAASSLDPAARVPWDLGQTSVTRLIGEMQWLGGSRELQVARLVAFDSRLHRDGAVIRDELTTALDSGSVGAVVVMTDVARLRGHAVLAYRIESDPADSRAYYIDVYDPNSPYSVLDEDPAGLFHEHQVDASRIHVNGDGSWSFPGLGGDSWDLVPLQPGAFISPHLRDVRLNAIIPASTTLASLTDAQGKALSLNNPPASGILPNPPLTGSPGLTSGSSFLAPVGRYTQTLTGAGALHETMLAPGFVTSVTTAHPAAGEKLTVDPAAAQVTLEPAAGTGFGTAVATIQVGVDAPGGEQRTATISGSGAADGLRFGFDRQRARVSVLVLGSHSGRYSVSLSATSRHSLPELLVSGTIALAPGDRLSLAPDHWTSLATARAVGILVHRDGRRTRVSLANRASVPRAVIVGLTARGGILRVRLRALHLEPGSTIDVFLTFHRARRILGSAHARVSALKANSQITIHLPHHLGPGTAATALAVTLSTGTAANSATSTRTIPLIS